MIIVDRHREALAGLSAGFATTVVAHPLDVIKLRLQLDSTSKSQWSSFTKIFKQLIDFSKKDGKVNNFKFITNLYRGLGPNLLGSTSAWAMYFFFYRSYKNYILKYSNLTHDNSLKSWHYLISAFMAGWTTSIITNPIWVIKTRMISTYNKTPGAYTSMLDGVIKIYKKEGFLGYYKGLLPALFNVSQGAVQLSLYDIIKRYMIPVDKDNQRHSTIQYLIASSTSKMISTCIFYPLQVIRSRLQVIDNKSTLNTKHVITIDIYKKEGVRAFYKGLTANLLRVVPATCTTFLIYEEVKQLI